MPSTRNTNQKRQRRTPASIVAAAAVGKSHQIKVSHYLRRIITSTNHPKALSGGN
jgi:hypothetical protein